MLSTAAVMAPPEDAFFVRCPLLLKVMRGKRGEKGLTCVGPSCASWAMQVSLQWQPPVCICSLAGPLLHSWLDCCGTRCTSSAGRARPHLGTPLHVRLIPASAGQPGPRSAPGPTAGQRPGPPAAAPASVRAAAPARCGPRHGAGQQPVHLPVGSEPRPAQQRAWQPGPGQPRPAALQPPLSRRGASPSLRAERAPRCTAKRRQCHQPDSEVLSGVLTRQQG